MAKVDDGSWMVITIQQYGVTSNEREAANLNLKKKRSIDKGDHKKAGKLKHERKKKKNIYTSKDY